MKKSLAVLSLAVTEEPPGENSSGLPLLAVLSDAGASSSSRGAVAPEAALSLVAGPAAAAISCSSRENKGNAAPSRKDSLGDSGEEWLGRRVGAGGCPKGEAKGEAKGEEEEGEEGGTWEGVLPPLDPCFCCR